MNSIPKDILIGVFEFLSFKELGRLECVSKSFQQIISNSHLWKWNCIKEAYLTTETQKEDFKIIFQQNRATSLMKFLNQTFKNYPKYLAKWMQNSFPFKTETFDYLDLEKRNVIKESEIPVFSRKKTNFKLDISSKQSDDWMWSFACKIAGIAVEKWTFGIKQLYENQQRNELILSTDNVTFGVTEFLQLLQETICKQVVPLQKRIVHKLGRTQNK